MFRLESKKALIMGGCGGIGSAIARSFHDNGATVLVTGTSESRLSELCNELNQVRVHKMLMDLSNSSGIKALVDEAVKTLHGIDILVYCAGITKDNLMIRMKEEDFDAVLNINLKAAFMVNKAVVQHMLKQSSTDGRIINISSVVGFSGNAGQTNYCASKAGMVGMSKALAREVGTRGITVNCIAPGFIESPMTDKLNEEQKNQIKVNIPLGRMGTTLDIAYAATYLASNEARYITGSTLHVNGGLFMN